MQIIKLMERYLLTHVILIILEFTAAEEWNRHLHLENLLKNISPSNSSESLAKQIMSGNIVKEVEQNLKFVKDESQSGGLSSLPNINPMEQPITVDVANSTITHLHEYVTGMGKPVEQIRKNWAEVVSTNPFGLPILEYLKIDVGIMMVSIVLVQIILCFATVYLCCKVCHQKVDTKRSPDQKVQLSGQIKTIPV